MLPVLFTITLTPADGGTDASDAGTAADASDAAPGAMFTIEAADQAGATASSAVTIGARGRVRLRWNVPGASKVAIDGAGDVLAVVTDGVPTYDDLTGQSETLPTQVGNAYSFKSAITVKLPFSAKILGEEWQPNVVINPHGVLSRSPGSGRGGSTRGRR